MGTNYYLVPKPECHACHRPYESEHIGKSSYGWRFLFRGYRDEAIDTVAAWRAKISTTLAVGGQIKDEYGEQVAEADFWQLVQNKKDQRAHLELARHGEVWSDEGSDLTTVEFS